MLKDRVHSQFEMGLQFPLSTHLPDTWPRRHIENQMYKRATTAAAAKKKNVFEFFFSNKILFSFHSKAAAAALQQQLQPESPTTSDSPANN